MPHDVYQNQTVNLVYELTFIDSLGKMMKPEVSSGSFMLVGPSGEVIVPLSPLSITSPNIGAFKIRPTSGTATIGVYKEIYEFFTDGQSFPNVDTLTVRERI